MDLFIRSQDKIHLMKCEALICENTGIGYGIRVFTTNYDFNIANYKTKERTLEILEDIQNTIFIKNMYEQDRELLLKSWENFDKEEIEFLRKKITVYEMPEE